MDVALFHPYARDISLSTHKLFLYTLQLPLFKNTHRHLYSQRAKDTRDEGGAHPLSRAAIVTLKNRRRFQSPRLSIPHAILQRFALATPRNINSTRFAGANRMKQSSALTPKRNKVKANFEKLFLNPGHVFSLVHLY